MLLPNDMWLKDLAEVCDRSVSPLESLMVILVLAGRVLDRKMLTLLTDELLPSDSAMPLAPIAITSPPFITIPMPASRAPFPLLVGPSTTTLPPLK